MDRHDIDERTTPLFLSSPERIGLAIGDEMDDWNYQFDDCDEGQITWYAGSNEPLTVCIEYVRADIAEKLRADLAAAQEELRKRIAAHEYELASAIQMPEGDYPKWKEWIIGQLQESYDTDGITHEDSGDALIYLQSAIAIIEDAPVPAILSATEGRSNG